MRGETLGVDGARRPGAGRAAERGERRVSWMRRAQAGDGEAYRALLTDVRPLVVATLRRWVRDPHDLEDLIQDSLVALHRARHTFEPWRPLEPWLLAIVRHVAAHHVRSRMGRVSREVLVAEPPEAYAVPAPVEPARLGGLLAALPVSQREAFEMLQLEGLSVEDAAARAGTTVGALKVRAHRAYKAVRQVLSE